MNSNNQVGLLDDSFVKLVQDQHRNNKDVTEVEIEKMESVIRRSKEKSITNTRQRVNGRVYPGKTKKIMDFKDAAIGITLAVTMIGLTAIYSSANKVMDYNVEVNKVVKENLSTVEQSNLESYENITESTLDKIKEPFEVLSQISDKKDELKATGDYKGGILNSQLTPDAISEVALENVNQKMEEMNEYVDGGQGYGK